jgi:hypothetical protein
MAELVRIAHDAHGLDPAFDDIYREHAPHLELGILLGSGRDGVAAGGFSRLLYEGGEPLRVDIGGPEECERLLTLTRRLSSWPARAWDTAAMKRAIGLAPKRGSCGAIALPPLSAYRTGSGQHLLKGLQKAFLGGREGLLESASRAASSASKRGRLASRCFRARDTSCRELTPVCSMMPAISAYA